MKSINKEMIKGMLEEGLRKNGHSLLDLEAQLASGTTASMQKSAEMTKESLLSISDLFTGGKTVATVAGGLAAGVGAGLGLGGFQAYKDFDKTQTSIEDKLREKKKIMDANKVIQQHLATQQT